MKRLNNELADLRKNPLEYADTYPTNDDMLEWIFELFGPEETDFAGGVYFGKIVLPPTYPSSPPDFYMLTPSGRFTINTKICLTISGFHKETWTSAWSIRTILIGLLSIMLDDFVNGISHIHRSSAEKKKLALESKEFNKIHYPDICKCMDQLEDKRMMLFKLKESKQQESKQQESKQQESKQQESKQQESKQQESKQQEPTQQEPIKKKDLDKYGIESKKKRTYIKKK